MHAKLIKVPHPMYSPDIAPCDFDVFGLMKNSLENCEFETEEELIDAINVFFTQKKSDYWKKIFMTCKW